MLYYPYMQHNEWWLVAILDDWKSVSIAFLAILDQYVTFFSAKWPPAAILDTKFSNYRKSLSITFLAISDQFLFFDYFLQNNPQRPFWMTENHFPSHFSPFQIKIRHFLFKMAAGGHFGSPSWAILDDRKSLSITFSRNCRIHNFFFLIFFVQNFVSPILPLCVINGYAKYEVDRWIYDTVRDAARFLSIFIQLMPKIIGCLQYGTSMAMANMNLIGVFVTKYKRWRAAAETAAQPKT